MAKVTGIGGVFFKSKDPNALNEWYVKNLGFVQAKDKGILFEWRHSDNPKKIGYTVWGVFKETTEYFNPSTKDHMFNLRVDNLEGMIEQLKAAGAEVIGDIQVYDYGKFGYVMDPEGNKIELWEPVDKVFEDMYPEEGMK